MGFDAPPHTGDDRNRERITLVADERGGAYVRMLDRRTRAQAFLRLGDDDAAYLEFLRWTDGVIQTRRLGFGPDSRSEEHTSELQSRPHLVCRLLLEKKKKQQKLLIGLKQNILNKTQKPQLTIR